jgi:hypothetical protein
MDFSSLQYSFKKKLRQVGAKENIFFSEKKDVRPLPCLASLLLDMSLILFLQAYINSTGSFIVIAP